MPSQQQHVGPPTEEGTHWFCCCCFFLWTTHSRIAPVQPKQRKSKARHRDANVHVTFQEHPPGKASTYLRWHPLVLFCFFLRTAHPRRAPIQPKMHKNRARRREADVYVTFQKHDAVFRLLGEGRQRVQCSWCHVREYPVRFPTEFRKCTTFAAETTHTLESDFHTRNSHQPASSSQRQVGSDGSTQQRRASNSSRQTATAGRAGNISRRAAAATRNSTRYIAAGRQQQQADSSSRQATAAGRQQQQAGSSSRSRDSSSR